MKTEAGSSPAAPSSHVDWTRVRRVLLVRLRSIGDTVLMTPCLRALKDWQPAVEIGVVTESLAAPILQGHPLVDRLYSSGKSIANRWQLIAQLRRERFDVAFNLHGGTTGMLLMAMSGVRHRIGYRDQRAALSLNERAPAPDLILGRTRIHSVEQQLALLHWAGVPMPERPRLALEIDSSAAASVRTKLIGAGLTDTSLKSARFAIVPPGAAFESKRWSSKGFAEVIDHLNNRWELESIVVAGPGQELLAREVADSARSKPFILSNVSLGELKALIGIFCRVFVGNDSGPMHIAAAFGCPIVAVFGSSNPDIWHPWTDSSYRVLGGDRGTVDSHVRDAIGRITTKDVTQAVDEVIQSAATRAVC